MRWQKSLWNGFATGPNVGDLYIFFANFLVNLHQLKGRPIGLNKFDNQPFSGRVRGDNDLFPFEGLYKIVYFKCDMWDGFD
jgi:hypothetical protein